MTLLTFPASLPGLAPLRGFELTQVEGAVGLYSLDSVDIPEVRLFALDPSVHLAQYSPRLDAHLAEVGAESAEQVRVLVVVNHSEGAIHANLLAPLLINASTCTGAQVILEGQDFPVRKELTAQTV